MTEKDLIRLSSAELVKALIKDNSLASEFDRLYLWDEIDPWEWCNLLSVQPQFADKCDWSGMWANNYEYYYECYVYDDEYEDFEDWEEECGEDYSEDWKKLLLKQPQLAEYFTAVLWDGFSQEQWNELEAKHPGVFEDKHMLSTLRKIAKD